MLTAFLDRLPRLLLAVGGLLLTVGGAVILGDAATVGATALGVVQAVSGAALIVLAVVGMADADTDAE